MRLQISYLEAHSCGCACLIVDEVNGYVQSSRMISVLSIYPVDGVNGKYSTTFPQTDVYCIFTLCDLKYHT